MSYFGVPLRNGVGLGLGTVPSLTNTPLSYRLGPSLDLVFAGADALDPRITFTRSTTATFTGSNGLVQSAAINAPRFDYSPTTLAPLGLLIEEQRTNLLVYSNDLSQSPTWSVTTATLTPNAVVSPDGTQNAAVISAASQNPLAAQFFTIAANTTTYCISAYVKYVSGTSNFRLRCALTNGTAVATNIAFNAETGAFVSSSAGAVYTITNAGNGWFKVSLLATNNSTNTRLNFQLFSGNDTTVTNSMAVYGAQAEVGAFPTSYIPTVASQVTRTADNASMTGTNFSSWFNATEGTLFGESATPGGVNGVAYQTAYVCDNTTANNMRIQVYNNGTANFPGFSVAAGSVNQASLFAATGVAANLFSKFVGAYKVNDFAFSKDGASVLTDTTGVVPVSLVSMFIGSRVGNAEYLNGTIKRIAYYPRRLSNAELRGITA